MTREPHLHIVLYQPEIPPNTGNAGRLCAALDLRLHVVHPIPFSMDEKAVRRAGLDYWKHVDLQEHATEADFWAWAAGRRVHAYTARARRPYTAAPHAPGDVLLFGCETRGLPEPIVDAHLAADRAWRIPITGPVRSFNLSNAVAIVTLRAMESVCPTLFTDPGPLP